MAAALAHCMWRPSSDKLYSLRLGEGCTVSDWETADNLPSSSAEMREAAKLYAPNCVKPQGIVSWRDAKWFRQGETGRDRESGISKS